MGARPPVGKRPPYILKSLRKCVLAAGLAVAVAGFCSCGGSNRYHTQVGLIDSVEDGPTDPIRMERELEVNMKYIKEQERAKATPKAEPAKTESGESKTD